jgi:hypothetical protein
MQESVDQKMYLLIDSSPKANSDRASAYTNKDIMVRLETPRILLIIALYLHINKARGGRIQEILKVYNKVSGQFLNKKN